MRIIFLLFSALAILLVESCTNRSEEPTPEDTFRVNDFVAFVDENPSEGQVIGVIDATTTEGTLSFSLIGTDPGSAIEIDEATGEVTVLDANLYVFAENETIIGSVEVTNGIETETASITININDPTGPSFNIWTGPKITFVKEDDANPSSQANQDRISDRVWITRGNSGGQIYNIQQESSANKSTSPVDTEWARGTIDNIANLTFAPFRDAVNPKNVVGQDLVLHLITDDVYIEIKFTSWSQNKRGGFAYERSSEN